MKILSAQQIREADAFTIENEPVASIDLMERAARACAQRIAAFTARQSTYYVFCGTGNNGGDGLAIARLLCEMGRKVEVFIIKYAAHETKDFTENLLRLQNKKTVIIHAVTGIPEIKQGENIFIIDALLGTGSNKPVEGLLAETIDLINASGYPVISIDIPGGLYADKKPDHKHIIKAVKTLTFQRPKLSFLLDDLHAYTGGFEILDIGLDEHFIEKQNSSNFYLTQNDVKKLVVPRKQVSHKGNYGHALLLAGSKGMIGVALLASKACLRSGAGLLTTHLPACGYPIMQTAVPEAMASTDESEDLISACPKTDAYSAIAMGPGIGTDKSTTQTLKVLIQQAAVPLVLDADAINILSQNKTWLSFLPPSTVLTPHPKEFDRLAGAHTSCFDRLESCKDLAQKHHIIIVLKGAHTAIVLPDRTVFFNSSGNAALAKGGSGDVLTGIILGLLASGYDPDDACLLGVFVHGHAADLYIKNYSNETMLASDLIEMLPVAFKL
jgi:hydroxyethylthiazole kinase-like uncharacterized protein yjeF